MIPMRICALATCLVLTGFNQALQAADNSEALALVIESRSEEHRARDGARHPAKTLEFFQVEPGMIVAEGLPGKGWYTNILANYLGSDVSLYGINYADKMWPMFSFATPEIVTKRIAATAGFPTMVEGFTDNGITTLGFTFDTVPASVEGSVDRV